MKENETPTTAGANAGNGQDGAGPAWADTARDPAFVERIRTYLTQSGMKQSEFARRIGTNAAYLSDYLRKPEFAYWREVQALARQWFAKQVIETEHKVARSESYIPTTPSVNTKKALQRISATEEIGIIYGAGGCGKTQGKLDFLAENSAAIAWDAKPWTGFREPWALERFLVRFLNLRERADGRRRSLEDVVQLLEDTGRILVIDDAQFLLGSTIDQLAFLNDAAHIPIGLIANPSILPRVEARPDQTWSRFGLRIEIGAVYADDQTDTLQRGYRAAEIRTFLEQYIERPSAKLVKLAASVAAGRGHLRRLDKAMRHVPKLLTKGRDDAEALRLVLAQIGDATQE